MTPAQHATEANGLLSRVAAARTSTNPADSDRNRVAQLCTRAHLHALLSRCPGTGKAYSQAETHLSALEATGSWSGAEDQIKALATLALAG